MAVKGKFQSALTLVRTHETIMIEGEMNYPKIPPKRNENDLLLSVERDVRAPIEIVFDVLTDFELFVELEEPVKKVTVDPGVEIGKGYKTHWELVDPLSGEGWELDEEILHCDRPYQYAYVGYGANGKDYAGVHNLSRKPDGSTHHVFNEVFHFDADPDVFLGVITRLVENVKKEAEKRHMSAGG